MPRFTRVLSSGFVVWAVVLGLWTGSAGVQGLEYVKANYTKYEYRIPMRDGVRLFTAVYVPKDQRSAIRSCCTRTPYSVGPTGPTVQDRPRAVGRCAGKEGFIFVYQDVRGRLMSEGQFVDVRPFMPAKTGRQDIDESTDTYDTIDWLREERAEQQRPGGRVGHLVSRLLRRDGHDRRAPGAQGRLAAGADRRLVHRRRLPPQRRALPRRTLRLLLRLRPAAAEPDDEDARRDSITDARRL